MTSFCFLPGRAARPLAALLTLLLALALAPAAHAQASTWQDAFNGGTPTLSTPGTSVARATAVDGSGNVYVTGSFTNQVAFGSTVLTSTGGFTDVFVAKWDATARAWAWAQSGGGTSNDVGYGVAVDGSGNVYVTGVVRNAATSTTDQTSSSGVQFGGAGLPSASTNTTANLDVFVASYTATGTYRWAQAGGGASDDIGYGVAVDGSGNVYATGYVGNAATSATDQTSSRGVQFGGTPLPSASTNTTANLDVFVASYTAAGAYRWAQPGGGTGQDIGYGVAVTGSGNVYVTGYVRNAATSASNLASSSIYQVQFGGAGLPSASTNTTGNVDVFVASYTATGAYRWAQSGGGTSDDVGNGVAVDGSGNVYVTGSVTNAPTSATNLASNPAFRVQFGGASLPSASASTSADMVVASYTAAGTYRWAQPGGGTGQDIGYGVAATGNTVAVATATGNTLARFGSLTAPLSAAVLGQMAPADGAWLRADAPLQNSSGASLARATAVDGSGNVYVTGSFANQVAFGSTVLTSVGSTDVFVAKWDATARAWAWAQAGGGNDTDVGYGVAVDGSGNVYVMGSVTNAATSPSDRTSNPFVQVQFGGAGLPSASTSTTANQDVFVASYTAAGAYRWAQPGGGTSNDSGYGLAVDGSGNVYLTGSVTNAPTSASNLASSTTFRVQFGGAGLPSASTNTTANLDVFVASYTATGAYRWAQPGGGTGQDIGYGIAVDGSGNVYATGYVNNAATSASNLTSGPTYRVQFGGAGLPSASTSTTANQDVFVASYTAAGAYRWAQPGGGTGNDSGYGLAVDGSGNVYATGSVTNAATSATNLASNPAQAVQFGGAGLPSASTTTGGNIDVFVASYTAAGAYRWAQPGGGTGNDSGYGLAVDGSDNVYATGYVNNAATSASNLTSRSTLRVQFGGAGLPSASPSTTINNDVFVASYTAAGTYRWAQPAGGTGQDLGYGVAVDGSGNVYATGSVFPVATFGSQSVATPAGVQSFFVARLVPPALTLTGVRPAAELPGQAVTLTGTGFTAASTVSFGGVAAGSVSYVSPTTLTAVVPVGVAAGSAVVAVAVGGNTVSLPAPAFEVLQVYRDAAASGCLSTDPLTLDGTGGAGTWVYLRLPAAQGGAVVAAIEDTRNLGTVTAGVNALGTATSAAVRQDPRNRAYLDRNFFLTATNPSFPNQTVRVRLFGLTAELSRLTAVDANATLAGLNASQYDGANQNCDLSDNDPTGERRLLPAPATQLAGADWFTAELTVAEHFSEFYLTGASAPLPVQLLTFTATAEGPRAARLAWATASERNSAYFAVERSPDGKTWHELAQVPAAGRSSAPRTYAHLDAARPAGPAYYRLRQVDADGTASYSPVRVLTTAGGAPNRLVLFPNPAHGAATLTGATPGAAVQLFDALGRPVAHATADAAGTVQLVLPAGLAAGVYIVRSGAHARRLTVE